MKVGYTVAEIFVSIFAVFISGIVAILSSVMLLSDYFSGHLEELLFMCYLIVYIVCIVYGIIQLVHTVKKSDIMSKYNYSITCVVLILAPTIVLIIGDDLGMGFGLFSTISLVTEYIVLRQHKNELKKQLMKQIIDLKDKIEQLG